MDSPINEYLRLLKMDEMIRKGDFPSVEKIEKELEVNERTVFRYRNILIEEFNAPLKYDKKKKGYYYSIANFSINDITLNESESFALQICERFSNMIFSGSELFQNLKIGLESLKNRANLVDKNKGKETADRIQFAFDYENMTFLRQRRQSNFENLLINAIKNGQLLKFNYQYLKENENSEVIREEIKAMPILMVMHELRWCILLILDSAFLNNFTNIELKKEHFRIIEVNNILSINPLKTENAKEIFFENTISTTGNSITETSFTKNNFQKSGLYFRFSISFSSIPISYKIFLTANLKENDEYEIDEEDFFEKCVEVY